MASLVVPGTSVTITLSSEIIAFKRLDLPTFGLPVIVTIAPSFSNRPVEYVLINAFPFSITLSTILILVLLGVVLISSVLKSNSASIKVIILSKLSFILFINLENLPLRYL